MKKIILIVFIVILSTQTFAQKIFGEGVINIRFNANTIVEFYDSIESDSPAKVMEFFDNTSTKSWDIKDLEMHRKWTNAIIHLDYSIFEFQYTQIIDNRIEIVANTETGKKYWIKKTDNIEIKPWFEYLSGMFAIGLKKNYPQKFHLEPKKGSKEFKITKEYQRCYFVKSMKGEWIEISTHGDCEIDDVYESKRKKIPSVWIKWRENDKIIIDYFHIA